MKNTVTQEQINTLLDNAETQEAVFWGKELVVSYLLPNGFSIIGRGACVDPANFDLEIGRKVARQQAKNKLWELEGYLLQNEIITCKSPEGLTREERYERAKKLIEE